MIRFILIMSFFPIFFSAQKMYSSEEWGVKVGEEVKYKIIYKFADAWATAGYVTFTTTARNFNQKSYWVHSAKGESTKAFDLFYKVRDEYSTMVSPDNFLPYFFLRHVQEGGFKIMNSYRFVRDSSLLYTITEDSKSPQIQNVYTVDSNTHDIVSAIFYMRRIDLNSLAIGESVGVNVFLDRAQHQIGVKYLGRQKISTEYGDFDTHILQPTLLKGNVFDATDQMRIYVSADNRNLPVYIESPLKIGKIAAIMVDYKK